MGLAKIIIQDATITASVKKARASRIFRLFNVDKYRYVPKKLAALIIEEFKTNKTPIKPISVFPIAVNRIREEKGVIIAHPGIKSLAFRSIDQKTPSSLMYLLKSVFWCLADSNLQRQASRVNLSCLQLEYTRCCIELVTNMR